MVLFIKKCSGASMYNLYDEEEEDNPPPISQVCFIKTHCFMNFNVALASTDHRETCARSQKGSSDSENSFGFNFPKVPPA